MRFLRFAGSFLAIRWFVSCDSLNRFLRFPHSFPAIRWFVSCDSLIRVLRFADAFPAVRILQFADSFPAIRCQPVPCRSSCPRRGAKPRERTSCSAPVLR
eukprot:15484714-Alexandrium_andersonii.AAC.1